MYFSVFYGILGFLRVFRVKRILVFRVFSGILDCF